MKKIIVISMLAIVLFASSVMADGLTIFPIVGNWEGESVSLQYLHPEEVKAQVGIFGEFAAKVTISTPNCVSSIFNMTVIPLPRGASFLLTGKARNPDCEDSIQMLLHRDDPQSVSGAYEITNQYLGKETGYLWLKRSSIHHDEAINP